jgi:hypothetical protein
MNKQLPKYRLFDYYEGKDLISTHQTLLQVAKACAQYAENCDNECLFELFVKVEEDETGARYKRIKEWYYTENNVIIND